MYPIFICEDNKEHLDLIKTIVKDYILFHEKKLELRLATNNPYTIIQEMSESKVSSGIYFLDIRLNCKLDGIDLGNQIRTLDPEASLIFITSENHEMARTFKLQLEAFDFIPKNSINKYDLKVRIGQDLATITKRREDLNKNKDHYFSFKSGSHHYTILIDSILYIQTSLNSHRLIIQTEKSHFEFYDSIESIKKKLPTFTRLTRSILINPKKILHIDFKEGLIEFVGHYEIHFNRRRSKKIKEAIQTN